MNWYPLYDLWKSGMCGVKSWAVEGKFHQQRLYIMPDCEASKKPDGREGMSGLEYVSLF